MSNQAEQKQLKVFTADEVAKVRTHGVFSFGALTCGV